MGITDFIQTINAKFSHNNHSLKNTNDCWYIEYFNSIYCFCQEQLQVIIVRNILAERLKLCRKEKGYTQLQVAIYCDITEKTYQNYELMTREPKIDILIRIADLYDVSIDYLVGRTDNKNNSFN